MAFPCYLAMTAAEFSGAENRPANPAWMACHFSPYATGLSNCPETLPEGAMLIVNDRTPIHGHDPSYILEQLKELTERLHCNSVLLDFQRPGCDETAALVQCLVSGLSCPVGVSEPYAQEQECPVFLPPIPVYLSAREYLSPWAGREIWLEAALEGTQVTVTAEEARFASLPSEQIPEGCHADEALLCHYAIQVEKDAAIFSLYRTVEDLRALLTAAADFGVTCCIGLYQELGDFQV